MPAKMPLALVAFMCAAGLAACNSSGPRPAQEVSAGPATPRLVTPAGFKLPNGPGCQGAVDRFQALIDEDLEVGHTIKSVHAQMSAEIAHARTTCAAGNDAGARAEIAASRSRHGYPGG
ncbi:MAG: hypothetical protein K2P80_06255 [Beijerinckiaceae bacterium]|nr:hypothetical protein [Beijerinckiaceae bacterium]